MSISLISGNKYVTALNVSNGRRIQASSTIEIYVVTVFVGGSRQQPPISMDSKWVLYCTVAYSMDCEGLNIGSTVDWEEHRVSPPAGLILWCAWRHERRPYPSSNPKKKG